MRKFMKEITAISLSLLMVLGVCAVTQKQASAATSYGVYILVSKANVHQSASTNSTVIDVVSYKDTYQYLAATKVSDGTYYKIQTADKVGFIKRWTGSADNVGKQICKVVYENPDDGENPTDISNVTGYEIRSEATHGLKVHKTASTSSEEVGLLPKGTVAREVGENDIFYKVKFLNKSNTLVQGYVVKEYATKLKNSADSSTEKVTSLKGYNAEVIASSYENARVSPSTSSGIINRISKGTMITVTGKSSHWYRVSYYYNGETKTAFISRSLSKCVKSTGTKKINRRSVSLKRKKTTRLYVRGLTCIYPLRVTWTSSKKSVATVDKYTGLVKGKKKGTAKLTAKVGSLKFKSTVRVK